MRNIPAVLPLIDALGHGDDGVRRAVARVLEQLADPRAVEALDTFTQEGEGAHEIGG